MSRAAWPAWREAVRAAADLLAGSPAEPGEEPDIRSRVLAGVVLAVGEALGWEPPPTLRALEAAAADPGGPAPVQIPPASLVAGMAAPDLIGAAHEALLRPEDRRRSGAHYTPPDLADTVLACTVNGWSRSPVEGLRALDPAVGGGAFLLAVARWRRAAGVGAAEVLEGLSGLDLDASSVAAAEAALACWAWLEGEPVGAVPGLEVGDGLLEGPVGQADLVVGNPPFLTPLARSTGRTAVESAALREQYGPAVSPYTDTAALFLLAGLDALRPGGRLALLQPESVLSARDAAGVRGTLVARARLVGLWSAGASRPFEAGVRVCAPVFEMPPAGRSAVEPVVAVRRPARARRWVGLPAVDAGTAAAPRTLPAGSRSWGRLLPAAQSLPEVRLRGGTGVLGDAARATAGFRDQFYGLVPHVREADGVGMGRDLPALVTSGLIDPGRCRWGHRPARFAGRDWQAPVVDRAALAAADSRLGAWVAERLVPKVVVATQTRVLEAVVDEAGFWVPSVPVLAVEPLAGSPLSLHRILAVLLAPPVTAWALAEAAGAGLSAGALKLSATQLRAVPLPVDGDAWSEGASMLAAGADPSKVGPVLAAAYGLAPDHPVVDWWRERLPDAS